MNPIFRLEKPCAESIENMHDISSGKFCDLCSKKVLDLGGKSDSQISTLIHESSGQKICGSFLQKRAKKKFVEEIKTSQNPKKLFKFEYSKIAASFIFSASLFSNVYGQSNNPKSIQSVQNQKDNSKEEQPKKEVSNFKIAGKITDKKGQKLKNGATVKLITISKIYETITDKDGNYVLEVPIYAVKENNLFYFISHSEYPSHTLLAFTKSELSKNNTSLVDEMSEMYKMYGEMIELYPYKNSLLFLNGKKMDDYKAFNKRYWLFSSQYEKYLIPKEFVHIFTKNPEIEDVFITFVKKEE